MLRTFRHWLHGQWPASTVEPLPVVGPGGTTVIPGVFIVGDLAGHTLLKAAAASGAAAIQTILAAKDFKASADQDVLDVAVVGAGVAGIAAAIAATQAGLRVAVYDAAGPFSSVAGIPPRAAIHPYPTGVNADGPLRITGARPDALLSDLALQRRAAGIEPILSRVDRIERKGADLLVHGAGGAIVRAQRVIVAIGRQGSYEKLSCPGANLDSVYSRLYDPQEFDRKPVLVTGDGDAAVETAVALATCGARVTFSHPAPELTNVSADNRAKLDAIRADPSSQVHVEAPVSAYQSTATMRTMKSSEGPGSLQVVPASRVKRVDTQTVTLAGLDGGETTLPNAAVFAMLGRESPLGFLERSKLPLRSPRDGVAWGWLALSVTVCVLLWHWKGSYAEFPIQQYALRHKLFPYDFAALLAELATNLTRAEQAEGHLFYTLRMALASPSFYFTFTWAALVTIFGVRRIRRTPTRYVLRQTLVMIAVQWIFLCLIPEIILPWMGRNGRFEPGDTWTRYFADSFFERLDGMRGHERAYWRAVGIIVPFPLNIANLFTDRVMWWWLGVSALQVGAFLPLMVRRWGKGGYCSSICPWGAFAETVGDGQREKAPHGPRANRWNMLGQGVLAVTVLLLAIRILGWMFGRYSSAAIGFGWAYNTLPYLNYRWIHEVVLTGIAGVGFCFFLSGRAFCRFACPLGALLHIYAGGTRFRLIPDKAKCISCSDCTRVCHAGVDVMNFANKDLPVLDPQCVRCSACVAACPTGALTLGFRRPSGEVVLDKTEGSLVQTHEIRFSPGQHR